MNWELIKKGISKEIESTINTIDPAFDIDICLNLYFKILKHKISFKIMDDLDGLEKNNKTIYGRLFNYNLKNIYIFVSHQER